MSPGVKKSIDHGRPFDFHGMWVMVNFREEKISALHEKNGISI
jgi:hypothetical protein